MKVCKDPYTSLDESIYQIELKKDYIMGMGDSADFAVVGGRRDLRDELKLRLGKLSWTTLYLGCLKNKEDVCRYNAKPRFRVVAAVDRHGLSKHDLRYLDRREYFGQVSFAHQRAELEIEIDAYLPHKPTHLFKKPMVVKVVEAGFDKLAIRD
jgi:DNA ligase 4